MRLFMKTILLGVKAWVQRLLVGFVPIPSSPGEPGWVLTTDGGTETKWSAPGGNGSVSFETDETLKFEGGILAVNTTSDAEPDCTLPITSSGVAITVGNINALLETI